MLLRKILTVVAFGVFLTGQMAGLAHAAEKSVALVFDASGSMNGRLADGTPKIESAKSAVKDLAGQIAGDVRLSFRAYGHQSHRSKHNCKDTQLLVPFGAADKVRDDVVKTAQGLKAQGYTPISYVLGLAADDLKNEEGKHAIVLVSDGKETCDGDPCLLARKLAESDAKLVIHTVGFGVDSTTKRQLQCIARAGRGEYFDAKTSSELFETMKEAVKAEIEDEELVIAEPKEVTGKLEMKDPYFNEVIDAETGKQVFKLTDSNPVATLPPGIYNVKFGRNLWLKSIEVKAGETTLIKAGRLEVAGPHFNLVQDSETGEVYEKATDGHNNFPLIAGRYDVAFGKALWKNVEIFEDKTTVLNPGRLKIHGPYFNMVLDPESGAELLKITDSDSDLPLPPGVYDVRFGKKLWKGVKLEEGVTTELKPARFRMEKPYFNRVIDEETGEVVEKMTDSHDDIPLPPGRYTIMFGEAAWSGFTVVEGQEVSVKPGRIKIEAKKVFYDVYDENGKKIIKLTDGTNDIPLPPGNYVIKAGKQDVPFNLKEGKRLVLKIKS